MINFFVLSLFLIGTSTLTVQAQTAPSSETKFGHVNTNELLQMMPGRQEAMVELQEYAQDLEETYTSMQNEFQTKYQDYIENQETFSDLVRQSREGELQSLQERIVEFEESAQEDIMQKEESLLRPIIEKAREAIEAVANENGYTYIFDTSGGSLVFWENGDDVMPLVQDKLDLDPDDMEPVEDLDLDLGPQ
ncbi:MAG: OmpH family outer membrane protein [Bacteroidales bacterium]